MKIWWFGNLLLFLVVIPAVLALLNRTVRAILDIQVHARNILENVVTLTGKLDEVPELLAETDEVVKQVADKVAELH